jgi:hypothetical protein
MLGIVHSPILILFSLQAYCVLSTVLEYEEPILREANLPPALCILAEGKAYYMCMRSISQNNAGRKNKIRKSIIEERGLAKL